MRKWRLEAGHLRLILSEGMSHVIDLRRADDISIFARSAIQAGNLFDSLAAGLAEVSLLLIVYQLFFQSAEVNHLSQSRQHIESRCGF